MDYTQIINQIYELVSTQENKGKIADYIPELSKVKPEKFGIYFFGFDKKSVGLGNYKEKFSIQSIAKVLSMSLAYREIGDLLWERIDVEPSGNSFNSLLQLEADKGIPRNPLINAGAIVVCDILLSILKNPEEDFLNFIRDIANTITIDYSKEVAQSEKSVGYRNYALCYYIKSLGNIKNNPIDVLDFYFKMCSIEMTCQELSYTFSFLANDGIKPHDGQRVLTERKTKRVNAIMQTCGFYDESGEFAFRVGLPGKSGVGGGIIAIMPNHYTISVWSPLLNEKGNSYRGMKFLEEFTSRTRISVF